MKKATLVVGIFYQKNKIFDLTNNEVNRDDCMYFYFKLKQSFRLAGFELATQDINNINESDVVIYIDMPKILPNKKSIEKSFLFIFESELIRPDNWVITKHDFFKMIFTWNDDYINNIKYFKMNFTHKILDIVNLDIKEKLVTLIAGNKTSNHQKELYSERLKAIRWFEKFQYKDFDFFGMGWNKFFLKRPFIILNRYSNITQIALKRFKTYKGIVISKKATLSKYKFAICYENARNIPGYITEKIFDCFFAGCVPIYLGAPNITEYIPKECFINKNDFTNYDDLYIFLKTMSDDKYNLYISAIKQYLSSKAIEKFDAVLTSNLIVHTIIN